MAKIKLTKSAVDAAQPQAQAVELRDTLVTAHKTVVMFMRYVHTEDKPVREAAELVASRRKTIIGARRAEESTV